MFFFSFVKILAAFLVLLVLIGAIWFISSVSREPARLEIARKHLLDSFEETEPADVEIGDRSFRQAAEFLAKNNYASAREKLLFIVYNYPESKAASEARRILGEMNLDELLSPANMEGKTLYSVKSGDSYLSIAARNKTTLSCLMLLNGLDRLDRLRPGDELLLLPLRFALVINPRKKRLTLMKDGRFVKAYPILASLPPPKASGLWRTTIREKTALLGARACPSHHPRYLEASKCFHLGRARLMILPGTDSLSPAAARGFYLRPHDIEELALLLRPGTEVEIRFPKKSS